MSLSFDCTVGISFIRPNAFLFLDYFEDYPSVIVSQILTKLLLISAIVNWVIYVLSLSYTLSYFLSFLFWLSMLKSVKLKTKNISLCF